MKSKLLLSTFDGSLGEVKIVPECLDTIIQFKILYYGENDKEVQAEIIFEKVISMDFEVNYFDNLIGAELSGFYEIEDNDLKKSLIERVFDNRKEGYLLSGDYNYDADDEHDMLNYRGTYDEMEKQLKKYHFYQLQTMGGIYHILAEGYKLIQ